MTKPDNAGPGQTLPIGHSGAGMSAVRSTSSRLRSLVWGVVLSLAFVAALFAGRATSRMRAASVPACTGPESLVLGCFAARLEALTRVSGAKAALSDLAERQESSGYLAAGCHQLTHVVGRTAGSLYGG